MAANSHQWLAVIAVCSLIFTGFPNLGAGEEISDALYTNPGGTHRMLRCAEPVSPLPAEAELKTRFDALDQQLNKSYGERIARTQKDQASHARDSQRACLKNRDAGLEFYLKLSPTVEKERRRLQFLGDVTAARIDVLNSADFFGVSSCAPIQSDEEKRSQPL